MLFQLEDYQMYISALGKKICIIFFCQYFPDFLNRDEQRVTYMVTLTLSEQFQKVDVLAVIKKSPSYTQPLVPQTKFA